MIIRKFNELRPRHYTNSVDMIFGPVVDTDETRDTRFDPSIEGNNIRRQNDVVTLDYSEVEYISQTFATRTESVTPFLISFWNGEHCDCSCLVTAAISDSSCPQNMLIKVERVMQICLKKCQD